MQCAECLYKLGSEAAKQAEFLAPTYDDDQDMEGKQIPRIRYRPVCADHFLNWYVDEAPGERLPFVQLSDGVLQTWDKAPHFEERWEWSKGVV